VEAVFPLLDEGCRSLNAWRIKALIGSCGTAAGKGLLYALFNDSKPVRSEGAAKADHTVGFLGRDRLPARSGAFRVEG